MRGHDLAGASFDAFFRAEFDRARRLAYLLTRSTAAADDVVQDAMLGVHQHFHRIEDPSAYLTRVVVNHSHRWHRQVLRRRRTEQELSHAVRATAAMEDEYLLDAVHALPYRQRVVVVARYWGGHTEAEIADMLGCRPGTVKSLAARALTRLRKDLPQ